MELPGTTYARTIGLALLSRALEIWTACVLDTGMVVTGKCRDTVVNVCPFHDLPTYRPILMQYSSVLLLQIVSTSST